MMQQMSQQAMMGGMGGMQMPQQGSQLQGAQMMPGMGMSSEAMAQMMAQMTPQQKQAMQMQMQMHQMKLMPNMAMFPGQQPKKDEEKK